VNRMEGWSVDRYLDYARYLFPAFDFAHARVAGDRKLL